MPPKKVFKIDLKQFKLTSFLKNTSSSAEKPKTDTPSVDYNDNDVSKEISEKKKDRKFQTKWLGLYDWLHYVPSEKNAEGFMICSVCMRVKLCSFAWNEFVEKALPLWSKNKARRLYTLNTV
ncbi:hypothetical protein DPMN_190697 [Dreissena polymorpha]|uniref:Uncharacterized protein n=1 Tax=Dreissena polymorpha TaxID=45954 RepID=A0A9D3Y1V0_DREPO|nr:hypothetical protein DPMN_190697 [Dreissena polymorpha]